MMLLNQLTKYTIGLSLTVFAVSASAGNPCEPELERLKYPGFKLESKVQASPHKCSLNIGAGDLTLSKINTEEMAELNHEDRQNSGLFWDDVGFNFWLANQEWKEGDAPWDKPVDPNSRIFQALPAEVQEDILGGAYYRLKVKDLDILKDTASYQKTIWNENKGFSEKISFVAVAEINFQGAKQSDSGEYIKGERPVFYSSRYERTFRIPLVVAIWPPKDNPDTPYIYAHSADIDTAFWESDEFTEELSLNILMPVMKEYFSSMDTFKKYASKILMPNTQGPKGSVVNPSRIGHNFQEQQEAAIYSGLIKNIEDKQIEVNQKY